MGTVQVTNANFAATVEHGIVVLDFWASWCGPCRAFAPIFERAAARHPDVVFGKVDTEAEPELAAAFGVRAIPTIVVLRDHVLLAAQPGALSPAALDRLLTEVRQLDMDEIRRTLPDREQHAAVAAVEGGA